MKHKEWRPFMAASEDTVETEIYAGSEFREIQVFNNLLSNSVDIQLPGVSIPISLSLGLDFARRTCQHLELGHSRMMKTRGNRLLEIHL